MPDESSVAKGAASRPWVILGCGRLGRALAITAESLGVEICASWNRRESTAREVGRELSTGENLYGELPGALAEVELEGAVVWVTVVDDAVRDVACRVADAVSEAHLVLHACGSLGASVLREAGVEAPVGSLHPLLAVTDPAAAADRFGECAWTVEGGDEASAFASWFTGALGAELVELKQGTRPLYHASAATAANLVVALFDAALEMATLAGLQRDQARRMLLPLLQSSVDNLREQSTAEALSGPAARGDDGTIERHRRALADAAGPLGDIYDALTSRALELGADSSEHDPE